MFQVEEREMCKDSCIENPKKASTAEVQGIERVCHEVSLARLSSQAMVFVSQELWKTPDYDMTGFTSQRPLDRQCGKLVIFVHCEGGDQLHSL